jgi:hypothetical protein
LKRAATVFSNQLPQAFPGFTQNEFGLIRTQLNQFKVLIDSARAADITAADQCLTAADGHVTTAEARVQLQQAQPQPAPRRGWSIWNPFGF